MFFVFFTFLFVMFRDCFHERLLKRFGWNEFIIPDKDKLTLGPVSGVSDASSGSSDGASA